MPRREKSAFTKQMNAERRESFGKWLVDQRTAAPWHFTQERAAEVIGMSRTHLSLIENGRVSILRETVIKIAKALDCPKEIALARAGYKVKGGTLDEKAYLARILSDLKGDNLRDAIEELILLYDFINIRKRKRRVFDLGTTRAQVARAIFLLHELPAWVRIEVLDYFNKVRERPLKPEARINPTRKTEMVEKIRSQIQGIQEKMKYGMNVCPTEYTSNKAEIGADVYIAVSIMTSGPMPPDYSILSIDACAVMNPEQSFYVEMKPLNSNAVPEALAVNKIELAEFQDHGEDPQEATLRFVEWVREIAGFGRPVFVGVTATLDWSFINWYARKFAGSNPFGYGAVDIRTYEMARSRSSWGAMAIIEDHGELNFWRNQSDISALEQARMFRESFRENTSIS